MTKLIPNNQDGLAKDWTPRQALLNALAQCDDYSRCIIILANVNDETTATETRVIVAGTKNGFETLGIINSALTAE